MENNKNKQKLKSFEKAAKPLMKWMDENCCPHDMAFVDNMRAQLFSGEITIRSDLAKSYDKAFKDSEKRTLEGESSKKCIGLIGSIKKGDLYE